MTFQLTSNPSSQISIEDIAFGESQASILYQQALSSPPNPQVTDILSETPFEISSKKNRQFIDKVWEGFKDEMSRLHGEAFNLQEPNSAHFMDKTCFHLQQSSVPLAEGPALQMSNGKNKWAIGANATTTADALVATLIYVQSKLADGTSSW